MYKGIGVFIPLGAFDDRGPLANPCWRAFSLMPIVATDHQHRSHVTVLSRYFSRSTNFSFSR